MEFNSDELDLFRQWYNNIQDVNPEYLEPEDEQLYNKVMEILFYLNRN